VTGGAGFIGSNFVRYILKKYPDYKILVLDALTYAGRLDNLQGVLKNPNLFFYHGDIRDKKIVENLMSNCDAVVHFAAETHVDRSVLNADSFITTDVYGTYVLLESARRHKIEKFVHISCYDEKTRALTTKGLKTYKELKKGDQVFSLNPKTLEIEIKPIEKVIIQSYKGNMVHFANKRIDLLATPNHNMFILNTKKKLIVETAREAFQRSIFYMPEGYWRGKEEEYFNIKGCGRVKTKDLMYILGIFIGDGFTAYQEKERETKTGLARKEYLKRARDRNSGRFKRVERQSWHKSKMHSYRIFLDIPESDKCRKKVEETLLRLDVKYHCHKGQAGTHLYFTSKPFMELFNQCGEGAHNKHIPRWALGYSPKYLKYLLQGLMDSDGHDNRIYHTVSKKLVSNICELCIKLNLKPSIHTRHTKSFLDGRKIEGDAYYIFVANTTKSIRRFRNKIVNYDGNIWCLKVKDNKNFIIERNGKLDFCGNTDEVYGEALNKPCREEDPLLPKSPYAASKCGGDRLAFSYWTTYNLPVIISRCSNNYGPNQYPEKMIPLFITAALEDKPLPVYGQGTNTRDWIYVLDHCGALDLLLHSKGLEGEVFNVGSGEEYSILEIAQIILNNLGKPKSLIQKVLDRPGHVKRHAVDTDKIKRALGFKAKTRFESGIKKTILWYKENKAWWRKIKYKEEDYQQFQKIWYEERK